MFKKKKSRKILNIFLCVLYLFCVLSAIVCADNAKTESFVIPAGVYMWVDDIDFSLLPQNYEELDQYRLLSEFWCDGIGHN